MVGVIASLTASIAMTATMATATFEAEPQWESIGEQRITEYCCFCNDGSGHESSSGKYLEYGDAACNWLPIGTEISIDGEVFTVADTCGTDAIDIFTGDDSGACYCNRNDYKEVYVLE